MTQGLASYTGTRFPTSRIGFNEAQYLAANPDVALMVQQGLYPSAQSHYETVGRLEGRSPLTGGNDGQTVAAGLQRYYNNLGLNGQSPFTTNPPTTPALGPTPAATDDASAAAQAPRPAMSFTPAGGGGSEGNNETLGGYGNPGTVGDANTSARGISNMGGNIGKAAGTLASIGLGLPGAGLLGTALGTAYDTVAANNTLGARDMSKANNPSVGFWDALKSNMSLDNWGMSARNQAERALEQQREYDRAAGLSNIGMSPAQQNDFDYDAAMGADAAAGAAAAAQAARDAAAQQDAAEGGGGYGNSGSSGGAEGFGGGYGGDAVGAGEGGGYGREANGGFIRALYAMGGLAKPAHMASGGSANIMPWDRVNADVDAQGLAAWSAYEASSAPLDAGAPTVGGPHQEYAHGGLSAVQPGNNPIHAARGTQVAGPGDGRSDNVPAMLSADEYVIPADVVAALGDGSSNAGAKVLADLVMTTREGYRRKLGSLPPPKA